MWSYLFRVLSFRRRKPAIALLSVLCMTAPLFAAKAIVLRVATDGSAQFKTVQSAIDQLPPEGGTILLAPGTYRERVWIKQSHVKLKGSSTDPTQTRIVFDLSAGTQKAANSPIPGMATVTVNGDDFLAEDITFENDFNRTHEQVSQGSQAQALNLGGDRNVIRNVHILGNQDTLYLGSKGCGKSADPSCIATRSYFTHCYIAGNVDFIYGDGNALFDHCTIYNTQHDAGGYITAQGKHYASQDSTFVFDHCTLTSVEGQTQVFLGRPWRPYASVVYLDTNMGPHIEPEGWREWHPGETHYLSTVFYAEYNSSGPGSDKSKRPAESKQLTAAEAAKFRTKPFLSDTDHWDPTKIK